MTWQVFVDAGRLYRGLLGSTTLAILVTAAVVMFQTENLLLRAAPLLGILLVYVPCLLLTLWRFEFRRKRLSLRQVQSLDFTQSLTVHLTEEGGGNVVKRNDVVNRGPLSSDRIINDGLMVTLTPEAEQWTPKIDVVEKPDNKEVDEVFHFYTDRDLSMADVADTVRMWHWGYRVKPCLEPGERVAFSVASSLGKGAASDAFSSAGDQLLLTFDRPMGHVNLAVHGPPNYFFEIIKVRAFQPSGEADGPETKWLVAKSAPSVDPEHKTLLTWILRSPIAGFKYICWYRLIKIGPQQ